MTGLLMFEGNKKFSFSCRNSTSAINGLKIEMLIKILMCPNTIFPPFEFPVVYKLSKAANFQTCIRCYQSIIKKERWDWICGSVGSRDIEKSCLSYL